MKTTHTRSLTAAALICAVVTSIASAQKASDPLPSWNDGKAKQSIIDFVAKVTTPGSPDFVPVAERVATFDNDGTLWCEQPAPVHRGNRHLGRVRHHARGSRSSDPALIEYVSTFVPKASGEHFRPARHHRPRPPGRPL